MLPVTAATQHLFPACCLQFRNMETGKALPQKLCAHSRKIVYA